MKKLCILLPLLLLTGCAQPEAFETMSDVYAEPETPPAQTIVALPENAAVMVMETENAGSIYLCDGFTLALQTMPSGDLAATLRSITGFPRDKLQIMERQVDEMDRYECVWAAAGEGGDQVGRAVVLDDGSYHYTLTLMAGADDAGELAQTWQKILDSFGISREKPTES